MAVIYRGSSDPEARADRERRLVPVVSRMRGMSDVSAQEAEKGRRKMRLAVYHLRLKRGPPYYSGARA